MALTKLNTTDAEVKFGFTTYDGPETHRPVVVKRSKMNRSRTNKNVMIYGDYPIVTVDGNRRKVDGILQFRSNFTVLQNVKAEKQLAEMLIAIGNDLVANAEAYSKGIIQ